MFSGGCRLATLENFEKFKVAAIRKNCNLAGMKSILCRKKLIFFIIKINVHFWNKYVPC